MRQNKGSCVGEFRVHQQSLADSMNWSPSLEVGLRFKGEGVGREDERERETNVVPVTIIGGGDLRLREEGG